MWLWREIDISTCQNGGWHCFGQHFLNFQWFWSPLFLYKEVQFWLLSLFFDKTNFSLPEIYLILADKTTENAPAWFLYPTPPSQTHTESKAAIFDHQATTWGQNCFISGFNLQSTHLNSLFDSCDVPVRKEFEQTQTNDTKWPCKCKQSTFGLGVTVLYHFS